MSSKLGWIALAATIGTAVFAAPASAHERPRDYAGYGEIAQPLHRAELERRERFERKRREMAGRRRMWLGRRAAYRGYYAVPRTLVPPVRW